MDILPTLLDILLVAFLIFMNGFFVAAEFCCVKIRTSRLETLIAEGNSRARYAKQLTDHLDYSLSVTQFGITLASLGLGWVGEPAIATLILPITQAVGLPDEVGLTLALALAFTASSHQSPWRLQMWSRFCSQSLSQWCFSAASCAPSSGS